MTGFIVKNGILHADDVALPALAQAYSTPLYVYSASKIRDNAGRLRAALAQALPADRQPLIAFACKANSNIGIIALMNSMGLGADIVSGGELARALKAGIKPEKIVFSGVGKSDEEITFALKTGILQLNVESKPELGRIAQIAQSLKVKAPVVFRVNPDVDAKTHAKITTGTAENKFGMPPDEVLALYQWASSQKNLHPRGVSVHIGSQLTDVAPYREAFGKVAVLVAQIRAGGHTVEATDLGGGLGIPYTADTTPIDLNEYAAAIRDIILPLGTQIILEPGRFLVAESGVLLTRVAYIKEGQQKKYLILDSGMNDLMRPALYEAYHPVVPVDQREKRPETLYDIVGPVCETGDTFATSRPLPEMKAGELAAIGCAGAYGFSMASHYNTRPLPAEIMVDGDKTAVIRQRDTIEDIISKEAIPNWV